MEKALQHKYIFSLDVNEENFGKYVKTQENKYHWKSLYQRRSLLRMTDNFQLFFLWTDKHCLKIILKLGL